MNSRADRNLRNALATFCVLAALSGCARRLLAPESARSPLQSVSQAVGTGDAWLVRLGPSVTPAEIEANYGCQAEGYIPELRLVLFRSSTQTLTTQALVDSLAADPRLDYSELDIKIHTAESRQSSVAFSEGERVWGDVADQSALVRVGAAQAQEVGRGAGVLIAILDTGIELDHPALSAQLDLPGVEVGVTTDPGNDRAEQVDTNGDGVVDGALGHGTHVAGIVHAIAPEARLLPVRVLDSDGMGDVFAVAHGIVAAANRGASVINISLGVLGRSRSVEAAIDFATRQGITIVAAAGNAGVETVDLPAAYDGVIAVASTDTTDQKATFSNYGPAVDEAAPGVAILSTYVGHGYALWSGTSMAAPFASGIAALLHGSLASIGLDSSTRVESLLRGGSVPLGLLDPEFGWALGAGRVSASGSMQALVMSLQPTDNHDPPDVRLPIR